MLACLITCLLTYLLAYLLALLHLQGAVNEVSQIEGETRGGRFGSTIAAVGDLNRDGYPGKIDLFIKAR